MSEHARPLRPGPADELLEWARRHVRRRMGGPATTAPVGPAELARLRSVLAMATGRLPPEELAELPPGRLDEWSAALKRAIARERGKARCGHRSYDANRHIALHQAARCLARLAAAAAARQAAGRRTA
ncbi:MAG: hypothetical protein BroJett030_32080 [Alphaproteobacteria bacterium]|nr:MAG: hypothetical protein BroJett030_32080 [Alphaproteobacteria bacterium]